MASETNLKLCILWEDELRTAARLLHEMHAEAERADAAERAADEKEAQR